MPERRYKRRCGNGCIKCWVNNLKHGNKESKAFLKKHPELKSYEVKHMKPYVPFPSLYKNDIKRRNTIAYQRINNAKNGNMEKVRELWEQEKELNDQLWFVERPVTMAVNNTYTAEQFSYL